MSNAAGEVPDCLKLLNLAELFFSRDSCCHCLPDALFQVLSEAVQMGRALGGEIQTLSRLLEEWSQAVS